LKNFSALVESNKITADVTKDIKEQFIQASSKNNISAELEPLREFLCEAFCLIDIVEELMISCSPEQPRRNGADTSHFLSAEKHRERTRFAGDTSLGHLASPTQEANRVGIDPSMISPIPNRDESHLGNSVNRYVEDSRVEQTPQEVSSQEINQTRITTRSPAKPKRQQNYELNASKIGAGDDELNRSVSPSRDLARRIQSQEKSATKKKLKKKCV